MEQIAQVNILNNKQQNRYLKSKIFDARDLTGKLQFKFTKPDATQMQEILSSHFKYESVLLREAKIQDDD